LKEASIVLDGQFPRLLVLRRRLGTFADWLAIASAVALPWSTTVTAILIATWFVTLLGSWNIPKRCREQWTAAAALPVVLWGFGILGVLWAGVPWAERLASLNSFQKLFMVPFLALQFRDSHRGMWVLIGFLISSTVLLIVSWGLIVLPDLAWHGRERMIGVPVKDYISQNAIFTLCIIGLAEGAFFAWQKGNRRGSLALVLLAIAFFANILYASVSRTALVALPILLLLFAFRRLGWKSAAGVLIAMMMFLAAAWPTSPPLRARVTELFDVILDHRPRAIFSSVEQRIEFWRKSLVIISQEPVFGHGTGLIRQQFDLLAAGHTGMAGLTSSNPHNQILATAIQLGLVGAVLLLAMWVAHLLFFFAPSLPAGIAFAAVVQNIIGSQFNSSLFDFTQGWMYVLGVGVLGGMVVRDSFNDRKLAYPDTHRAVVADAARIGVNVNNRPRQSGFTFNRFLTTFLQYFSAPNRGLEFRTRGLHC
jgi:O-antigen ligase